MKFVRRFTTADRPVAEQIEWEVREASIPGAGFRMDVEVPKAWSQDATNVFAQKYLRKAGVPSATQQPYVKGMPSWLMPSEPQQDATFGYETSARQVFHRMAGCWTYWGWREEYFVFHIHSPHDLPADESARVFYDELYWMLAHQYAAPNSPQWFNTGLWWAYGIEGPDSGQWTILDYPVGDGPRVFDAIDRVYNSYERPQVHACYIQPVADTLVGEDGMLDLWSREARLFKHGSGTGTNFSSIRAKGEPLSGGGVSSGLMSFLRVGDANAGSIKSGGVTRRAAKMCVLDLDHPEIEAFIDWKVREETKAAAMHVGSKVIKDYATRPRVEWPDSADYIPNAVRDRLQNGFEPHVFAIDGMEAEAVASVDGQNSNNSVRVPDEFIQRVNDDKPWLTHNRVDGSDHDQLRSTDLWRRICRAAWACGDPGLQFNDTINAWHTCPNDGEIRASNPCSEYLFLDNTACNLASLNLGKFLDYKIIDRLGTPELNYDDKETIDAVFDCDAFEHAVRLWTTVLDISVSMASYPSREIAEGSYNYRTLGLGYANLGGLLARMDLRYDSDTGRALAAGITALMTGVAYQTSAEIAAELGPFPRWETNAEPMWMVLNKHRYKIDLDAKSEVADRAHDVWSKVVKATSFRNAQVTLLAPTGTIRLVMDCETSGVEPFYARSETKQLAGGGTMLFENPGVRDEDCAVPSEPDSRFLDPLAHVRMVAAVQPFLSGGVSKTVNLPHSATVEDVDRIYREAHRLGLKSVAVYRDGSKLTQPVSTSIKPETRKEVMPNRAGPGRYDKTPPPSSIAGGGDVLRRGQRRELPSKRPATSRTKLEVAGHSVYLSTGDHEDGELAEIFLGIGKEGSDVRSWADCFSKAISIALQYGVPLGVFVDAFERTKFEPAGLVGGATRVRFCDSLPDLVFRHLAVEYLDRDDLATVPRAEDAAAVAQAAAEIAPALARATHAGPAMVMVADMCPRCGTFGRMRRAGPCLTCTRCGEDNGGCG